MPRWGGDEVTDRLTIRTKKDKFLAWDIETAQTDILEGDDIIDHLSTLGISCAATLTSDKDLQVWQGAGSRMTGQQCRRLVQYLEMMSRKGYVIVGFNSASFDFRVLAEESGAYETCKALALDHVDFGLHFFYERGFMPSLNAIALGMQLEGKSGHGSDVPRLWAEGKRQQVLDYVAKDVEVTLAVFQAIRKRGEIRWISKSDRLCSWRPESGRLLTVREAMKLPEPDTSWMTDYWGREKFTSWLTDSV